jgi:signal peptidase
VGKEMAISELINSTKKLNMRCLFLIGILLVIYAVENYFPISLRTNPAFVYIGKPVLWLAAITAVLSFPRVTAQSKLRLMSTLRWLTVLLSGAYIVILIIIGFIAGFAKSPYSHSAFGIITNLISVYTALAGRELIRNYLINSRKSRNNLTLALVTVLMTLTSLSVDSIIGLRTKTDMIEYIGLNFLPGLSGNILASYLVSIGGPALPIIYIGIQQCFISSISNNTKI